MGRKQEIRCRIREIIGAMSAAELDKLSLNVCDGIYGRVMSEKRAGMTILLYWPLRDEVQTSSVAERLYKDGHRILLPVVDGDSLLLREYCGVQNMRAGAFGILEPQGGLFDDFGAIDLAFIPGRAFTADGLRLGRGKGYYDRLLPQIACPKIGVCFQFQIVGELPSEPHDIPMDEVIASF